MNLLTILTLAAAAAPAEPQWLKLFEEPDEVTFVQRRPAGSRPSTRMIWIRHDYRRPRPGGVTSARDQWLVDCRSAQFTMYALVSYDRRGRVLKVQAIPEEQRQASPVVPGSRMERVLSAVCS